MAYQAWTYSTKQPVKRAYFGGMKSNDGNFFDEVVVGFKESSVSRNNPLQNNECEKFNAQCKRKRFKKRKPKELSAMSLTNEDQEGEDASFLLFKYESSEHKKRKLKQKKKNLQKRAKNIENRKKPLRKRIEQPSEILSSDTGENDLCLMVEVEEKRKYNETTKMNCAPDSVMSKYFADINKMFKKRLKKKTVSNRNNIVDLSMEAPRQELQDCFHISLSGLDRSAELELKESLHESQVKCLDDDAHKNQFINSSICQPSLSQHSLADDKEEGCSDFVIISSIYGSPPLTKNYSGFSKCHNKSVTVEHSVKPKKESTLLNQLSNNSLSGECHKGRNRSLIDTESFETVTGTEENMCAKSTAGDNLSKNNMICESFGYTMSKDTSKCTVNDEKMNTARMSETNKCSVCAERDSYSKGIKRKKSPSDVTSSQIFKDEASTNGVLIGKHTDTQSTAAGHSSSYITCTTSEGHSQNDMSHGVASGSVPSRSTDYTYSFVSTYSEATSSGRAMSNKGALDSPHVNMKKFLQLNSTCYRSKENIGDVQFPPSISPILNARERTPKCQTQHAQLLTRPVKTKPKTETRNGFQATRKCSTMLFGSDVEDINFQSSPGLTTVMSGYTSTDVNGNKNPPPIEILSECKRLPRKQKTLSIKENSETPSKNVLSKVGSTTAKSLSRDVLQDPTVTLRALELNNTLALVDRGADIPIMKTHKSQEMNLSVKKGVQFNELPFKCYPIDRKEKGKKMLQRECTSPINKPVTKLAGYVSGQHLEDGQLQESYQSPVSEKTNGECDARPDVALEHYKKQPIMMKSSTPVDIGKPLTVSLGLSPIPVQDAQSEEELCILPSLEVNSDEIIVPSFISISELMDKDKDLQECGLDHPHTNSKEKTTSQIPENAHGSTSNPGKQLCVTIGQRPGKELDASDMSGLDGVEVGGAYNAEMFSEKVKQSQPDGEINLDPEYHGSKHGNQSKISYNSLNDCDGKTGYIKTTQRSTKQCEELSKSTVVCMINRFIHKLRKRDGFECI